MRTIAVVASFTLSFPILAAAEPTCAVPLASRATPVSAETPASGPYQSSGADRIARIPALRRLASQGAQLFDLGVEHGLQTVFARNGSTFQVYFVAPDGQAAVGGVMWDSSGKNLTRPKVELIDGVVPTVTIGSASTVPVPTQAAISANLALPVAPVNALAAVEQTAFGTTGATAAPRLYMLVDPLCSFSVRAMDELAPYVTAGKIEVALIPISILDYEDRGQSTPAAQVLLTVSADTMVEAWRKQTSRPPVKAELAARALLDRTDSALPAPGPEATGSLARNMAAAQALNLRGTPTFVWRKADGSAGLQEGMPANIDTFVASLGR
jgi:thiol:disulfide interchange protein DsbG